MKETNPPSSEETVPRGKPSPAGTAPSEERYLEDNRYLLVEICGEGGFGAVWRTRDRKLGREIAVKRLSERLARDPDARQRFVQEAQITSRLEHPGVVPIYDVGSAPDGTLHYTMKLVHGRTLADAIVEFHALPRRSEARSLGLINLLGSFLAVARTMEYAHSRGVVHRDLKPQNIILGEYGETVVLDWGIAKLREQSAAESADGGAGWDASPLVTQPGTVKGTPAYMAPEQAAGKVADVDERTDVYALGAILYELLTGQIPFDGPTAGEVQQLVLDTEPLPPRRFDSEISPAMEAVCLKAMAKSREARYADVRSLREDLERCLADEPISAYRESFGERLGRWSRRHRAWTFAIATALALVSLVSVLSLAIVTDSRNREATARADADAQRDAARKHADLAQQRLQQVLLDTYNLELLRVRGMWASRPAEALEALDDTRRCPVELRDFCWGLYRRLADRQRWSWTAHSGFVSSVALSPDGQWLASAGEDRSIRIAEAATGKEKQRLEGHQGWTIDLAFSPAGDALFSAGADKTIRQWSVGSGALLRTIPAHDVPVNAVAISPRSDILASGAADGTIRLWEPETGKMRGEVRGHDGEVLDLAFTPGTAALVSAGEDGAIQIWNPDSLQSPRSLLEHTAAVQALACSGDGKLLVSAGHDGLVLVWDLATGSIARRLAGHSDRVYDVALSASDRLLASASWDRTIRLWDLNSGQERTVFSGQDASVLSVCLTPDDATIVSGSASGRLSAWATAPEACTSTWNDGAAVLSLAFLDADRLASAGGDPFLVKPGGHARLWDLKRGELLRELGEHPQTVTSLAMADSQGWLAIGGADRSVRLWDANLAQPVRTLGEHEGYVWSVAFSPDASLLASAGGDKRVKLWDPRSGRLVRTLDGHGGAVHRIAFDPSGKRLASAGWDKTIVVWSVPEGRELSRWDNQAVASPFLSFSPDGNLLLTAGSDTTISARTVPSGEVAADFKGHAARVNTVCCSPDNRTFATADQAGTIRLWDPVRGQERAILTGHESGILALRFSPDSRRLASGDEKGTIKIWTSTPPGL